jgi:hypothetical protein
LCVEIHNPFIFFVRNSKYSKNNIFLDLKLNYKKHSSVSKIGVEKMWRKKFHVVEKKFLIVDFNLKTNYIL